MNISEKKQQAVKEAKNAILKGLNMNEVEENDLFMCSDGDFDTIEDVKNSQNSASLGDTLNQLRAMFTNPKF